jgi:hypothetical protein
MGETQEIPKLGTIKFFGVNYGLGYAMGVTWVRVKGMGVVATLALGSRPKQGLAKGHAKRKPGVHISCSRECKKM